MEEDFGTSLEMSLLLQQKKKQHQNEEHSKHLSFKNYWFPEPIKNKKNEKGNKVSPRATWKLTFFPRIELQLQKYLAETALCFSWDSSEI